jgi:small-conductance mechanosensitive channel
VSEWVSVWDCLRSLRSHARTNTHTHTRTQTHARTRTHTHARVRACTQLAHSLTHSHADIGRFSSWGADCHVVLLTVIIDILLLLFVLKCFFYYFLLILILILVLKCVYMVLALMLVLVLVWVSVSEGGTMYKHLSGPRATRYHHTTAHISKPAVPGVLVWALGLGCVAVCVFVLVIVLLVIIVLFEVPPYHRKHK